MFFSFSIPGGNGKIQNCDYYSFPVGLCKIPEFFLGGPFKVYRITHCNSLRTSSRGRACSLLFHTPSSSFLAKAGRPMQDSPHFRAQGLPLPILIGGGSFRGCSKGGRGLCMFAAQPTAPLTAKSPALSKCNRRAGLLPILAQSCFLFRHDANFRSNSA
jgi:hypothetical protein